MSLKYIHELHILRIEDPQVPAFIPTNELVLRGIHECSHLANGVVLGGYLLMPLSLEVVKGITEQPYSLDLCLLHPGSLLVESDCPFSDGLIITATHDLKPIPLGPHLGIIDRLTVRVQLHHLTSMPIVEDH